MKLSLYRVDGERLEGNRMVWGAEVTKVADVTPFQTAVIVPDDVLILLRRQLEAPRNAGADLHDLIEKAANVSGAERGWPTPIVLTSDDLRY